MTPRRPPSSNREDPHSDTGYADRMKDYLVNIRGIDPQRINIVQVGEKEKLIVEL